MIIIILRSGQPARQPFHTQEYAAAVHGLNKWACDPEYHPNPNEEHAIAEA